MSVSCCLRLVLLDHHPLFLCIDSSPLQLKKLFVSANKDKEAMVMKYAMRERDILVQSKAREEADKKCQLALKDKEDAVAKMKSAVADRNKFQLVADSRLQDIQVRFRIAFRLMNYIADCSI